MDSGLYRVYLTFTELKFGPIHCTVCSSSPVPEMYKQSKHERRFRDCFTPRYLVLTTDERVVIDTYRR